MMFETKRLIVETLCEDHFEFFAKIQGDPDVMRYIGHGKRSRENARMIFDRFLNHGKTYGFSFGCVYEKKGRVPIGFAGLIHLMFEGEEIEIGYYLFKEFWGKGYGTELAKGCISWGFSHLDVDALFGIVQPANQASRRVLEKAGMTFAEETEYGGIAVQKLALKRKP